MRSRRGRLKIKATAEWSGSVGLPSSGRQDAGRPEVKGQIAEIDTFDRQQFEKRAGSHISVKERSLLTWDHRLAGPPSTEEDRSAAAIQAFYEDASSQ